MSPPHLLVQKGEDIGLPSADAEMEEVVPIVHRVPDGRVNLQSMWLAELFELRVQRLAGRKRVVIFRVNEECRRCDFGERDKSRRRNSGERSKL